MSDPETLSALDEVEVELEHPIEQEKAVESERPYFFQLDVLKAIAIIFVVMDHSLSWDAKSAIGSLGTFVNPVLLDSHGIQYGLFFQV